MRLGESKSDYKKILYKDLELTMYPNGNGRVSDSEEEEDEFEEEPPQVVPDATIDDVTR